MTKSRMKTISLTLAVAISLGSLSACASTTAASTASIAVPADPVKATVTVTALSLDGATVKLPDGTEFTIPADELPNINDLSLGDEITIEYTQNADGSYSAVVTEEEAPADESESASESEPTTESEPVSEEEAKAEEKTAEESSKQAQSASTQSSTSAAASTASTSTATSKASESAAVSKTSTSSSKLKPEVLFANNAITVDEWDTPAVTTGGVQYMTEFLDADGNVLGSQDDRKYNSYDAVMKSSGYDKYDPLPRFVATIKAFNDYRGVDTPYVVNNSSSYYLYNASTDSFTLKEGTPPDVATSTTGAQSGSDMFDNVTWTTEVPDTDHIGDVYVAIDLINEEREKEGLDALEIDEELMELADTRAQEIVENFSHIRPDGTRCAITHHCWENIARGYYSAEKVVKAWMKSQGHKDNILEERTTRIGVGCAENNCWVMLASD